MPRLVRRVSAFFILSLIALTAIPSAGASDLSDYEVLSYSTNVIVDKRKTSEITHTFSLRFTQDVPKLEISLPITGVDSRITLLSVEDRDFDAAQNGNSVVLTVEGDNPAGSISTYIVSYTLLQGIDPSGDGDLYSLDLVSSHWTSDIAEVNFSITMPEDSSAGDPEFYSGYYGDMSERVKWQRSGGVITGSVDGGIMAFESMSLSMIFPEGYFRVSGAPMTLADRMTVVAPWLTLIFMAAAGLIWFVPRRGLPEKPQRRAHPPEGCTPADAAYILRGTVKPRQLTALVLYWANLGYLTIDDGGHRDELILQKSMSMGAERKQYERLLFGALFTEGDSASLRMLRGRFHAHLKKASDGVDAYWRKSKDSCIYRSGTLPIVICRLLSCVSMGFAAIAVMNGLYQLELSRSALLIPLFALGFCLSLLFQFSGEAFGDLAPDRLAGHIAKTISGGFVLAAVVACCVFFSSGLPVVFMSVILSVFSGFTAARGALKTDYGESMTRQLIGLRAFMTGAEKKRLYELASDSPSYFYDILPYAVSMGVADQWASRWLGIPLDVPSWFGASISGGKFSSLDFIKTLGRITAAMTKSLTAKPDK